MSKRYFQPVDPRHFDEIERNFPRADVSERWTTALMHAGWTTVSNLFLERYSQLDPPITHGEAMFIIHLMQHKWNEKAPYPSLRTIAGRMGVSTTSTRSMARSLEKKGYLWREKQAGHTNRYHLNRLFKALEEFQPRPSKATQSEPVNDEPLPDYATENPDFEFPWVDEDEAG